MTEKSEGRCAYRNNYKRLCASDFCMVERVTTGIDGLDDLIEGGLPKGSVTLVSGGAGTGKTIFCCQYLWNGLENGENGLFVTMEEDAEDILNDAREFGWDFEDQDHDGTFDIQFLNPFQVSGGFDDRIREYMNDIDADRVVIDSTSVIGMYSKNKGEIRRQLYELIKELKRAGVTAVLTSEIPQIEEGRMSRFGVEEFVTDGAILLSGFSLGEATFRSLQVVKMRRTAIEEDICALNISDDGISVEREETL